MNALKLNQRARISRRGGAFTLIELLLVMVIITILATILVPKVVGHLEKAKITAAQADLSTLKQSLTSFYIDNGRYPTTSEGLQALIVMPSGLDATKWVKENRPGLPDGMKVDVDGNLWATGPGGVWIFSPDGTVLGNIDTGTNTANVAFGNDGSMLYIAANHDICRVKTTTKGKGF